LKGEANRVYSFVRLRCLDHRRFSRLLLFSATLSSYSIAAPAVDLGIATADIAADIAANVVPCAFARTNDGSAFDGRC
jgi:hypothetical protein